MWKIAIVQVEENDVKRDRKIENRNIRYKGPDNKRPPPRSDKSDGKDKKDRTLDPMDPASYSDIPRYIFIISNTHLRINIYNSYSRVIILL